MLVADLVAVLTVNRGKHQQAVQEAYGPWRKELDEKLDALQQKVDQGYTGEMRLHHAALRCYVGQYNRAIAMLERHQGDRIELGAEDYRRFVDDQWDWKQDWNLSNAKYLGADGGTEDYDD